MEDFKFKVGDRVNKVKGEYQFPGILVANFRNTKGHKRVVVELDELGLLHIYNEGQLEKVDDEVTLKRTVCNDRTDWDDYEPGIV